MSRKQTSIISSNVASKHKKGFVLLNTYYLSALSCPTQHILTHSVSKSNAWSGAFGICYWRKKYLASSPLASHLEALGRDTFWCSGSGSLSDALGQDVCLTDIWHKNRTQTPVSWVKVLCWLTHPPTNLFTWIFGLSYYSQPLLLLILHHLTAPRSSCCYARCVPYRR